MTFARAILTGAATVMLLAGAAQAKSAIEGDWLVQDGSGKVRIAPCAGQADKLCGKIFWAKAPKDASGAPRKDVKNPVAALRGRTIVGLPLITGFTPSGPNKWAGGKIYNPEDGKTYNSKLELTKDGKLKVSGCVMVICKTQTWTRAS